MCRRVRAPRATRAREADMKLGRSVLAVLAMLLALGAVGAAGAAEGGAAVEGVITAAPAAGGKAAVQDVRELPLVPPWQPGDPISVRPPRVVHGSPAPEGPEPVEPQAQVERGPHLPANFT